MNVILFSMKIKFSILLLLCFFQAVFAQLIPDPDLPGELGPSRSDCHAWSASPLIGLISAVAGIRPGDFGFESVIVEPKPGNLDWIKASCPHYLGNIEIDLKFSRNREARGTISLPPGISGIFIWEGNVTDLDPGKQKVQAKPLFFTP